MLILSIAGDICNTPYVNTNTYINNVLLSCGYMYGVPQRQDGGSNLVFDSGSRWSKPLYMCASATKALVKTVSFNFNGTRDLQSLAITDIRDKVYPGETSLPLWGVENVGNTSDWGSLSPVWGLISKEYSDHANVSSVQQESLYLPGQNLGSSSLSESLPGSDFLTDGLLTAYNVGFSSSLLGIPVPVDYSGNTQMAMWVRWQNLSRSAATASKIINLIWTDYAASAVVGTKGVLGPGNLASRNTVTIEVTPFHRRVKFHLLYGLPALATALLLVLLSATVMLMCFLSRVSLIILRKQMQRASTGRLLTAFLYPEEQRMESTSQEWSRRLGGAIIELPVQGARQRPHSAGPSKIGRVTEPSPEGDEGNDIELESGRLLSLGRAYSAPVPLSTSFV